MAFVPAPGYQPAYNPPLPYVAPIVGGLWPGMAVYVQGVVPPHADRFQVNLETGFPGGGQEGDLALHLNPRFGGGEGQAVLNSRRGGAGGSRSAGTSSPSSRGGAFELVISVTPECYRILVNGSPFAEFGHRVPPELVGGVTVDGDLELQAVSVLGAGGMQPPPPIMSDIPQTIPYGQSNLPMMALPPTLHPPVPFVATIPGGLVPKKTIVIKGFIPPDADRFHVNLRAGGEVLLHLNPRPGEGAVVRNSLLGGAWGEEERDLPHNPFQRGRYFDLSIRCGNHRFKIFAEGQPLCHFAHRLPPGPHVDTLEVEGDVVLSYVHF